MRILTILVVAMVLFGCGSRPFAGTFVGNTAITMGRYVEEQLTFTTSQTGNQVSGSFISTKNTTGTIVAQVDGTYLPRIDIVINAAPANYSGGQGVCSGTLNGTGVIQNRHWLMTLSGNLQNCGYVQGLQLDLTQTAIAP